MKILLTILLLTSISMGGLLFELLDGGKKIFFPKKKVVETKTETTEKRTIDSESIGKVAKVAIIGYGLISIEGYASEVKQEIVSAEDKGRTTYTPLMCGDKVVPMSFKVCPKTGETPTYGSPISL